MTVLEKSEGSHRFGDQIKEIIGTNTGVTYTETKRKYYDEVTREEIIQTIEENDFTVFELNTINKRNSVGTRPDVGNIFESHPNSYVATSSGGSKDNYEEISNQGYANVSLAGRYRNGRYYIHDNNKYTDPQCNPITNDTDSPLLVGIDIGSTSGAAAANAATWALVSKYLTNIGINVDRAYLDTLLKNKDGQYDDLFEPAFYAYTDKQYEWVWTDEEKGKVLILKNLINHFKTFAFNPEIKNLKPGEKLPLLKNQAIINTDAIIIGEEKAISYIDGVAYIDYDLGIQQGLDMEIFLAHIDTEIQLLIGDKNTKTVYWQNF